MGAARDSAYYDRYYRSERGKCDLLKSYWAPLWRLAAKQVEAHKLRHVVDVGCGTGPIARLLSDRVTYVGYDFSPVAIERARREFDGQAEVSFVLRDARSLAPTDLAADGIILCEILEHLADDLGLVRKIPAGRFVFFTVPTFDMWSHVRHFPHKRAIMRRYGRWLNLKTIRRAGEKHFVAWGRRR